MSRPSSIRCASEAPIRSGTWDPPFTLAGGSLLTCRPRHLLGCGNGSAASLRVANIGLTTLEARAAAANVRGKRARS